MGLLIFYLLAALGVSFLCSPGRGGYSVAANLRASTLAKDTSLQFYTLGYGIFKK
jgi:hypothetical protein